MGFFGPINGAGAGTVSNKYTYSGAGFGAGGGAVMHNGSSTSSTYNASGGNAGEIIMGSHILSSTAAIAITVGIGGVPSAYSGSYAAKGADGCVAVFW